MVKPIALMPMPSASAAIAAAENQRLLHDQAEGEPQILQHGVDRRQPADVPVLLFEGRRTAEANQRRPAGLFGGHAAADVVLGQHGEVRFELPIEVVVERRREKRANSREIICMSALNIGVNLRPRAAAACR